MRSNILELVKKQESEILEFKPSLSQIKDVIETISAFSNTKGGSLLIGVDDKRNVIGADVGEKTIAHKELSDLVEKNLIERRGKGRSSHYVLRTKRTISGRLADDSRG